MTAVAAAAVATTVHACPDHGFQTVAARSWVVVAFAAQLLQLLSLTVLLQQADVEHHKSGSAATTSPTSFSGTRFPQDPISGIATSHACYYGLVQEGPSLFLLNKSSWKEGRQIVGGSFDTLTTD